MTIGLFYSFDTKTENFVTFAGRNHQNTKSMATVTLQYDGRSASAKSLLAFLRTLNFVKICEDSEPEYNPEMVAKVKRGQTAFSEGKCVTIKAEDIWN